MSRHPSASIHTAGKYYLLFISLFCTNAASAQKSKADSLKKILLTEKRDTNRVRLMWQLADVTSIYNPDTALRIAQQAVYLSKDSKYLEGQSKSLASMANAFIKMGNYPRALELYFQKLQLEEKRNIPHNLASVLNNIGIVYTMQEEYNKALEYYYQADSVIQQYNVEDMKYFILLNLGDVYNRLGKSDSSYNYFSKSFELAKQMQDTD